MNTRTLLGIVLIAVVVIAGILLYKRGPTPAMQPAPAAAAVPALPTVRPIGAAVEIKAPLGLPAVPIPADNPPTAETIALGRRLYFDPLLSADGTVSCASCHDPKFGFADPKPVSEGVQKKTGNRNSPPVLNAAYYTEQFWDGRAPTLEKQAEGPVQNPVEMAHTLEGVAKKLSADASYVEMFEKAYGPGPITYEKVGKAIASFERTVLAGDSPFDRWFYGGDQKAVSESVKRGFEVFRRTDKGNCAACHTVDEKHALFMDNKYHNLGVGVYGDEQLRDLGRYEVTKNEKDKGAFKTPSLRNIAQTAPYMHDGSQKTLKEVIDFYIGGGNSNPHRDPLIKPLDFLTGQERTDLENFLKALTGRVPKDAGPPPVTTARQ